MANGQIGEVEGALIRAYQIGRQLSIGCQTGEIPAPRPECQQRAFGVVHRLVPLGIGEPVRERVFIGWAKLGHHDVCRGPVSGGEGEGRDIAGSRTPVTDDVDAGAIARRMLGEPAHELTGLESRRLEVETTLGHDLVFVRQRLEQSDHAAPGIPDHRTAGESPHGSTGGVPDRRG